MGCGVIGPTHAESYLNHPDAELTWCCDLIPERAKALAQKYNIPNWTTDATTVFAADDVDAVSICTDHASHAALCIAALSHGKDVLCEKALANNLANLNAMLAAEKQYPERIFSGVFQHRFSPVNRTMRDILGEGLLGTLLTARVQLNCFRSNAYYTDDPRPWRGTWALEGGSVLINQAIHFFDQLLWQTGGAQKISGMTANRAHQGVIETEDAVAAVLTLNCGAIATLTATSASHLDWDSSLEFHGTRGTVRFKNEKVDELVFADKTLEAAVRQRLENARDPEGVEAGKAYYGTGHAAQIADFVSAVQHRTPPYVTISSAAETVKAVFDIYAR